MNKRIKTKWIKALRSREYKQCKDVLKNNNTFCCLGVLCDLHAKEKKIKNPWQTDNSYLDTYVTGVLPKVVISWSGLPDANPVVGVNKIALSDLNDTGTKFNKIANYIEKWL